VRLHGASSRYFPKKSLRLELADQGPVSGTYGKKLLLRAEYNDKTMLRNWLALRMFFAATHIPTPRSKLVHLRINDRFYGVMHNVERIDDRLLDHWGLPRNGSLYEGDPIDSRANPGANLTPVDPALYPEVYQHQSGAIDYTDLRMLIEDTLTLPDAALSKVIESTLVVDDYIDYLAMMAAIQNVDHIRKNYYLYRETTASRGWQILPWDLDLSFGHLWSEEQDVLDEAITSDVDIFIGEKSPELGGFYNQLITRVLGFPSYRTRFRQRVGQLLSQVVTRERAQADLQRMLRCATPDIAADSSKRATNQEYLERVNEIGDFLDARALYVQDLPP
jgi:spore coat protein CotH